MNYNKIYNNLIDKCKNTDYPSDTYTEKHHIIPKCMGGTNESSNLVQMSAREHIMAHILLSKIYPNVPGVVFAAYEMTTLKQEDRLATKWFSTRTLASLKENAMKSRKGEGNPMYGKKQSEETKKLISKINTGRKFTEEQRAAHSIKMKNRIITEEWKNNISKSMIGKPHPHKSPNYTKEGRQKMVDLCKNRTGENHPNSKKIIDEDTNIVYNSITECAKAIGISRESLSYKLNHSSTKRFKFI